MSGGTRNQVDVDFIPIVRMEYMLIQPLDKLAVGFRMDTVQNPYHIWIYSIYHLRWVMKISGYLELIFWHLTQLVDRMFWSPVWKCFAVYKRREPLVQMLLLSMCKFYCLNLEICFDTEVGNSFRITEATFETFWSKTVDHFASSWRSFLLSFVVDLYE